MTEPELLTSFSAGLILGGVIGICAVLAYGRAELRKEQQPTKPKPTFNRARRGPWRDP